MAQHEMILFWMRHVQASSGWPLPSVPTPHLDGVRYVSPEDLWLQDVPRGDNWYFCLKGQYRQYLKNVRDDAVPEDDASDDEFHAELNICDEKDTEEDDDIADTEDGVRTRT